MTSQRLTKWLPFLAILIVGITMSVTQAGFTRWIVDTEAKYQSGTDSQNKNESLPAHKTSARSIVDLANDGFSFAEAKGRSEGFQFPQYPTFQGSDLDSFSRAAGFDPSYGPPDQVLNASSATQSRILWRSNSDANLRPGVPIVVEVTLGVVGQIAASHFVGSTFDATSEAVIGLQLTGGRGGTIDYYGEVLVEADPMDGFAPPMLTDIGDWSGDFQLGQPIVTAFGGLPKYEIDTVETFLFDSRIGDPFALDFHLDTLTDTLGPFEVYTLSDFAANYRLRALDPVTRDPLVVPFLPDPSGGLPGDCNGDGVVDAADLACACANGVLSDVLAATGLLAGDFDGNGSVDFSDFLTLSSNFGQSVNTYVDGDVDCDGQVSFADFQALSTTFGQTQSSPAVVVPEPSGVGVLLIGYGLMCLVVRRP